MSYDLQQTGNYVEKLDLTQIQGIYVTEDPEGLGSVRMWCGYCCTMLYIDHRHMGVSPFLSLMAKMADAHRATDCLHPEGPFHHGWSPRDTGQWQEMASRRVAREKAEQEKTAEMITEMDMAVPG